MTSKGIAVLALAVLVVLAYFTLAFYLQLVVGVYRCTPIDLLGYVCRWEPK